MASVGTRVTLLNCYSFGTDAILLVIRLADTLAVNDTDLCRCGGWQMHLAKY